MRRYSPGNYKRSDSGERKENQEKEMVGSRKAARKIIYKIIILSGSIVGFSVSLFSINAFVDKINLSLIYYSWYSFIACIIIGFFSLLLESRSAYAEAWIDRGLSSRSSSFGTSFKVYLTATKFLIISLFYPGIYTQEKPDDETNTSMIIAANWLIKIKSLAFVLEILTFFIFIAGLILLVNSFSIN